MNKEAREYLAAHTFDDYYASFRSTIGFVNLI
jgi:hypothetical protein